MAAASREHKTPHAEHAIYPATPRNRKFDSIAWLIQGCKHDCGAAWFDGTSMVLATNNPDSFSLVKQVVHYLKYVAEKSYIAKNKISETDSSSEQHKIQKKLFKKCDQAKEEFLKYAMVHIDLLREKNRQFTPDYLRAVEKITRTLQASYLDPTDNSAFPTFIADAIRNEKFIFIGGSKIHAELKIAQAILSQAHKKQIRGSQYVGISKRCCDNCDAVIRAINICSKKVKVGTDAYQIDRRDEGHGIPFPSPIPVFLEHPQNALIKTEFLRIVDKNSLDAAFRRRSDSLFDTRREHHDPSSEAASRSVDDSESSNSFEILADLKDENKFPHNLVRENAPGRDAKRDFTPRTFNRNTPHTSRPAGHPARSAYGRGSMALHASRPSARPQTAPRQVTPPDKDGWQTVHNHRHGKGH